MLRCPDSVFLSNVLLSFSVVAGIWIKPSRTSRMREKRADFVAGCLGGRVIAAGGLGQQLSSGSAFLSTAHSDGSVGLGGGAVMCSLHERLAA